MITEQLENIIKKYQIMKTNNIIYGTNIPMPKKVIPTPWKTYIRFDASERYFFYFDEKGIIIYPTSGETYANIPWSKVVKFKISYIFIIGKMTIKMEDGTVYKFQINKYVVGCPWIKTNREYLENYNYFYNK